MEKKAWQGTKIPSRRTASANNSISIKEMKKTFVVQSLSCVWLSAAPRASLFSLSPGVCSNSCLLSQWCYLIISSSATSFSSLTSIFPSIRVFSNELALQIRWPKYWSFSFSINTSSEYSGLVSFKTDWFDLLAIQGTFKNLLQYYNLKASILRCSAFFILQLSNPYMTSGKIIALAKHTFVSKVMSLLLICCLGWS